MAAGLVKRYREAGEAPPKVIYVDRDCCSQHGPCRVKAMFAGWDELHVRLDIWHFMRHFAAGVTTEAHPLYGILMARLSTCIFEWDREDVAALRRAREGELAARSVGHISEEVVTTHITRRELALHCRRRTRGVEETNRLIRSLISLFDSASGRTLWAFLCWTYERIQQIWMEQQKHLGCIQDPEDLPALHQDGHLEERATWSCAATGTSASDAHFQAYLLEGLMRWNDHWMEDAVKEAPSIRSYSSALREAVDQLSQKVLGRCWDERYRHPWSIHSLLTPPPSSHLPSPPPPSPPPQAPASPADVPSSSMSDEAQVTQIVQLWTALPEVDKQRVNYQPRHQDIPGGPAQWPSTSRLVEAICTKLCSLHKSPTKKSGVSTPRWSKILDSYHHIRELVLNTPRLMAETTLQLFELNQKTLIQWFQRRQKTQEMSVLSQGMAPTNKIPVAPNQLLAPKETLELLPPTSGPRHQFVLPPNLEGQAPVLRPGRRPAAATPTAPGTAPNPTAPGTAQPMSAHLGNLVLNPDNTLSLVLAAPGVSTPSAGPAQLGSTLGAPVSRFTERTDDGGGI
ncbi:uncharacterized protein LOC119012990 [Acanthopagrus latus]|uniref:uncharacterized protein LOC119012990 n=1 Tax=Acanthopagrus latus TaxID=8177 RepID=UPI00187CA52D|nr:uncharacterized protein LOC119012990 [Acanthopagrus latus]